MGYNLNERNYINYKINKTLFYYYLYYLFEKLKFVINNNVYKKY